MNGGVGRHRLLLFGTAGSCMADEEKGGGGRRVGGSGGGGVGREIEKRDAGGGGGRNSGREGGMAVREGRTERVGCERKGGGKKNAVGSVGGRGSVGRVSEEGGKMGGRTGGGGGKPGGGVGSVTGRAVERDGSSVDICFAP